MDLNSFIVMASEYIWGGWGLILFIVCTAIAVTFYLRGVQFVYFVQAWRSIVQPSAIDSAADMTPLQAFFNALSASIGNGSIAGMAAAIYSGGPGAAIWLFLFGFFAMALRFAEVYLSTAFGIRQLISGPIGGPMVYLSKLPLGMVLASMYALIILIFSLVTGSAMQANSIQLGIVHILPVQPIIVALALGLFMTYVMFGGARRIVDVSMKIAPLKVILFGLITIIALIYHYRAIIPALSIMVQSAFGFGAFSGGIFGVIAQKALRFGLSRGINASEAGLGTASIVFGGASAKEPVKTSIMSMAGSFVTSNIICFSLMLIIVASGVWDSGKTSIDLTIAAYETVYGAFGGWIITFLAMMFGLGTIVAYAYIARSCWTFLTNGRWITAYNILFALVTLFGSLARVDLIWNATDLIVAALLLLNLCAILYLLPVIRQGLTAYRAQRKVAKG